jgi:hypothetical protein
MRTIDYLQDFMHAPRMDSAELRRLASEAAAALGLGPPRPNLHAPYPFKQPPDQRRVAELATAHHQRSLGEGTLGQSLYNLRRQLAEGRRLLHRATPGPQTRFGGVVVVPDDDEGRAHRTALLVDLARASRQHDECETAVLIVTRAAEGERSTGRCPRCHREAPVLRNWYHDPDAALTGILHREQLLAELVRTPTPRADRLVLEHQSGSMLCSGTGEVVR